MFTVESKVSADFGVRVPSFMSPDSPGRPLRVCWERGKECTRVTVDGYEWSEEQYIEMLAFGLREVAGMGILSDEADAWAEKIAGMLQDFASIGEQYSPEDKFGLPESSTNGQVIDDSLPM